LKSTSRWWRWSLIAAGIAAAVCLSGFVLAVKDIIAPPQGFLTEGPLIPVEEAPLAKDTLSIVALGDSLTKGTGDQTGKGYVIAAKELLELERGKPVHILGNYAVNGYKTDQLLNDLKTKSSIVEQLSKADIILLTIGGNDLYAIGRDLLEGSAEQLDPAVVKARMPEPLARLEQILAVVSEANPKATVMYMGLYNPFYDMDTTGELSKHVREWNNQAAQYVSRHPRMIMVPTFDLFQLNFAKYMYSDHFHPNREGYQRMAERVVQALQ
jgi:lysophospholipase L1-like esterase